MPLINELYLSVLPLIHMGANNYGYTEQTLTLFPDKNFATRFHPDEVQTYIDFFKRRLHYLTGGHVEGYEFVVETTADGVIVRVVQNVR
jgi:hypothetical protein